MQLTAQEILTLINNENESVIILFDDLNNHSEISVGGGRAYTFQDTHLEGVAFEKMQNNAFKEFKEPLDLLKFACYASNDEE